MTILKQTTRRAAIGAATAFVLAAAMAGCGSSPAGTTSSGTSGANSTDGASKTIRIGIVQGWSGDAAVAYISKKVLESKGYTVEVKSFSDISVVFLGTSKGDLDAMPSWPEATQKASYDQFKDKLEDIGSPYGNGKLFLAVPDYMTDIKSISDLPAHASEFDGKIVGIEPGAGLTKVTQEKVIPDYGLGDSFKLQVASTAAMLAEVKKATDAKEPIVVTIWSPFWANKTYPLRPLEDPKGAYGKAENMHVLAQKGFSQKHPDVAEMMSNLKLTEDQVNTLDDLISNKYKAGQEEAATKEFLDQNPDIIKKLEQYIKS